MTVAPAPAARLLLVCLVAIFTGCGPGSNEEDREATVRQDLEGLQRLITIPVAVVSVDWQTGERAPHGDDWWLAAVLQVNPELVHRLLPGEGVREVFETPPGMEFSSSFAAVESLPGADPVGAGQVRVITTTYPADPFFRDPLMQGKIVPLSDTQILVVLWTS